MSAEVRWLTWPTASVVTTHRFIQRTFQSVVGRALLLRIELRLLAVVPQLLNFVSKIGNDPFQLNQLLGMPDDDLIELFAQVLLMSQSDFQLGDPRLGTEASRCGFHG